MRLQHKRNLLFLLSFFICCPNVLYAQTVSWISPAEGDAYQSGDIISAAWKSQDKVVSPSFALCTDDGEEECGSAIWPTVTSSGSSKSSASITVPNITAEGSFFIKMKSDTGELYSSPIFGVAPVSLYEGNDQTMTDDAQQPIMQPPQRLTSSMTISQTSTTNALPLSTQPIRPSSMANPNNFATVKPSPNSLALAIPLTMLGMACLGAFGYAISRRRRQERKAGGNASGLQPTHLGMNGPHISQATSQSTTSSGSRDCKDAKPSSFFNLSLNKTESELSQVEKAVFATINGAVDPVRGPQGLERRNSPGVRRLPRSRRELRRVHSDRFEPDDYTSHPPKSWQGYDGERKRERERQWYLERQQRRARERELDELLEAEILARSRRRIHPPPSPSPRSRSSQPRHAYDEWDEHPSYSRSTNCTRSSQRCYDGHSQQGCCSRHDSSRRSPSPPIAHRCTGSHSTHHDYSVPSRAPAIEVCSTQTSIKAPAPRYPEAVARAPSAPVHGRYSPGPSPMVTGNDHNLSVISSYLAPSPYISSTAGFASAPYLSLPAISIPKSPSALAGGINTFSSSSNGFSSGPPPGLEDRSGYQRGERRMRSNGRYRTRSLDTDKSLPPSPMM